MAKAGSLCFVSGVMFNFNILLGHGIVEVMVKGFLGGIAGLAAKAAYSYAVKKYKNWKTNKNNKTQKK